jgi:hypothetical protein
VVVGAGLVLLAALGVVAFLKPSGSEPRGRLAIDVVELPKGSDGSAVIRGPAGFRRNLRGSASLEVAPGHYVVEATPVPVGNDRYYAMSASAQTHVVAGHTARVTVDYRTIVPATTHHLAALPGLTYSAPSSTLSVSPTPPQVASLKPNDVLLVDSISGAPDGLLVKVTAITVAGQQTTLNTLPAALEQAFPRGHFETQIAVPQPSAATRSSLSSPGLGTVPIALAANVEGPSIGLDWKDTFHPSQLQGLGCPTAPNSASGSPATTSSSSTSTTGPQQSSSTTPPTPSSTATSTPSSSVPSGTQASFTPEVHFHLQPFVDITADWSLVPPHVSVNLAIGAKEDFSAGLASTASYNCDVTKSVDLLPNPPHIEIPIGPFPLVVTPSVTGQGEAKGQASGSDNFKVTQSAAPSIKLGFGTDTGFSFDGGLNAKPVQVTNQGNATGSAELSVAPQLTLDLEGRGGPSVSVLGYLMGSATTSPPGAGLWLGSAGHIGIDLDLFVKTITGDKTIYDTGPTLVWHTGTTPSVPFEAPAIQTSSPTTPPLPVISCQSPCSGVAKNGSTVKLEKVRATLLSGNPASDPGDTFGGNPYLALTVSVDNRGNSPETLAPGFDFGMTFTDPQGQITTDMPYNLFSPGVFNFGDPGPLTADNRECYWGSAGSQGSPSTAVTIPAKTKLTLPNDICFALNEGGLGFGTPVTPASVTIDGATIKLKSS